MKKILENEFCCLLIMLGAMLLYFVIH